MQLINNTSILPRQHTRTTDIFTWPGQLTQNNITITVLEWMELISKWELMLPPQTRFTTHTEINEYIYIYNLNV